MTKSLLMKLFTVTIFPLIIAPVLTYAVPNPNPNPSSMLPKTGGVRGDTIGAGIAGPIGGSLPDWTKDPKFAPDLKAVEETMHRYSVALDSKNLGLLDVLFETWATLTVDPTFATLISFADVKKAIVDSYTPLCSSTVHNFVIEGVHYYGAATANAPGAIYTVGSFNVTETCHGIKTTYLSHFADSLSLSSSESPGGRRCRFVSRYFDNGLW